MPCCIIHGMRFLTKTFSLYCLWIRTSRYRGNG